MKATGVKNRDRQRRHERFGIAFCLVLLLGAGAVLIAGEQEVESFGQGHRPEIDANGGGDALAVWVKSDGDGSGINLQPFCGMPIGHEYRINETTAGDQDHPDVVHRMDGSGFVAWQSEGEEGTEIRGRLVTLGGMPIGRELRLDTTAAGRLPAIDSDASGRIAVAWSGTPFWPEAPEIFYQPYVRLLDDGGMPIGRAYRLDWSTGVTPPSLAMQPRGEYVVAWQDGLQRIKVQSFDDGGMPIGRSLRLDQAPSANNADPAVAALPNGTFLVIWERIEPPFSDSAEDNRSIVVRVLDGGMPIGREETISMTDYDAAGAPAVAVDSEGRVVVTWRCLDRSSGHEHLLARLLDDGGMPIGREVVVNSRTAGSPLHASVTAETTSDFPVVWEEDGPRGSEILLEHLNVTSSDDGNVGFSGTGPN